MSQQDVFDFLESMRKINGDRWFRASEIRDALAQLGFSNGVLKGVSDDIVALASYGLIDYKGVGVFNHHKEFRAKK